RPRRTSRARSASLRFPAVCGTTSSNRSKRTPERKFFAYRFRAAAPAAGHLHNAGPFMRRSSERILTTHAGSLPRPEDLTGLFVRRARAESIDADTIAAAGLAAVRAIVPRQAEAGVDIGNNGEQQHDSFFLYLKERLTGLGGSWQRPSRA